VIVDVQKVSIIYTEIFVQKNSVKRNIIEGIEEKVITWHLSKLSSRSRRSIQDKKNYALIEV